MTLPPTEVAATPQPAIVPADADTAASLFTFFALLKKYAEAERDELDRHVRAQGIMRRSHTLPVDSPLQPGVKLATVSMTNPKTVINAEITSDEDFNDWARTNYPDRCVPRDVVIGSPAQIIEALRDYCPDDVVNSLVTTDHVPDAGFRADVIHASKQAVTPIGPGGEMDDDAPAGVTVTVTDPRPTISVKPTPGALEEFSRVLQTGKIPPRLQIPAPATDTVEPAEAPAAEPAAAS